MKLKNVLILQDLALPVAASRSRLLAFGVARGQRKLALGFRCFTTHSWRRPEANEWPYPLSGPDFECKWTSAHTAFSMTRCTNLILHLNGDVSKRRSLVPRSCLTKTALPMLFRRHCRPPNV